MFGYRLEPRDHKLQEPLETNAHGAADPAQRDPLEQQPLNQRSVLLRDDMILRGKDKGTATRLAAVVLFTRVNVAVSLVPRRSTLGTCFSGYRHALSRLPSFRSWLMAQSTIRLPKALPE